MFFWKWTRSGKESKKYVSLIIDFHSTQIRETNLITNFEECKDILYLIHDVEVYNAKYNKSAGLEKESFQKQVQLLGYKATSNYIEKRNRLGLVSGQMVLGRHEGTPLDYGYSNKTGETIILDTNKLKWALKINVENGKAGKGYGSEDKLKAY